MDTISLSDHNAKVVELGGKINDLEAQANKSLTAITSLKEKNVELTNKVTTLEDEKAKTEKTAKNEKLFNDGKINKAMLDALNEGKSLEDVLALNEKMPLVPKGGAGNPTKEGGEFNLTEEDKLMCTRMGLTEKEYVEYGCDNE